MKYFYIVIAISLAILVIISCGGETQEEPEVYLTEGLKVRPLREFSYEKTIARIERGKYLTESVLQCFACHSERDWSKPGAPIIESKKGAGAIFLEEENYRMVAPNITPDNESGAGNWTDDMIGRAIREGIGHDGRALGGAMWFWALSVLSDEDLASVVVYLRTIPPVKNKVLKRKVSLDLQRAYVNRPSPIYNPILSPDMNNDIERGKYLVKVADCSGCHTVWEAPVNPGFFGGGNFIERQNDSAFSSNITLDQSGIFYDENVFVHVMRTGKSGTLSGVMPWIAFKNMTEDDLKAIYKFLKTLKPVRHYVNNISTPRRCSACGQIHGFGEMNKDAFVRAAVSPDLYDDYTGRYMFEDSLFVKIYVEDEKLMILEDGYEPSECIPVSENEFRYFDAGLNISFERNKKNKVTHLVLYEMDELVAKKIE